MDKYNGFSGKLRPYRPMILVICVALLVRIIMIYLLVTANQGNVVKKLYGLYDGQYLETVQLIATHGFMGAYKMNAMEAPLYPLYLSLLRSIFGSFAWPNVFSQVILTIISIVLICLLAKRLDASLSGRHLFVLGLLIGMEPNLLFVSVTGEADILFLVICMITLFVCRALLSKDKMKNNEMIIAGALSGLATLTKPVFCLWPIIFVLIWYIWHRSAFSIKRVLIFCLSYLLVCGVWYGFVYINHGSIGPKTEDAVVNYIAPRVQSLATDKDLSDEMTPVDSLARHAGLIDLIRAYPGQCVQVYIEGVFYYFTKPAMLQFIQQAYDLKRSVYHREGFNYLRHKLGFWPAIKRTMASIDIPSALFVFYSIIYLVIIYTGIVLFAIRGRKHLKPWHPLLISWCIYFPLMTGPLGNARYRIPIIPILCIFAVFGFLRVKNDF